MKQFKLASLGAACSLCLTPLFGAAAEPGSMMDIIGLQAVAAGPGAFGPIPGKSMLTLYGTMDAGLDYTRSSGKSSFRIESGNVLASKWGIYGQEDLGGQSTAFFRLESAFNLNNGSQQSQASLFNRGSYVGLSNPALGTVSVGRQLSGEGIMAIGSDVFLANAHQSIFTYLSAYADLGYGANVDLARINNSISYTTPRYGAFSANLFYALKSNQAVGPQTKNRSVTLSYIDAQNMATASYSQTYCEVSPASTTPCVHDATVEPSVRTDNVLLTYIHDFGSFTGALAYMNNRPRFAGDYTSQMAVVGVERLMGRHLMRASIGYRDTTQSGNHAWGMTVGEDYYLSRRTSLYMRLGFLKNGPKSAQTYNFDATNGFPLPVAGNFVPSATIGMMYNF